MVHNMSADYKETYRSRFKFREQSARYEEQPDSLLTKMNNEENVT